MYLSNRQCPSAGLKISFDVKFTFNELCYMYVILYILPIKIITIGMIPIYRVQYIYLPIIFLNFQRRKNIIAIFYSLFINIKLMVVYPEVENVFFFQTDHI